MKKISRRDVNKLGVAVLTAAAIPSTITGAGRGMSGVVVPDKDKEWVNPWSHIKFPTGLDQLDERLGGGIEAGSLVVIAGETGTGKSKLIQYIAGSQEDNAIVPAQTVPYEYGGRDDILFMQMQKGIACGHYLNNMTVVEPDPDKLYTIMLNKRLKEIADSSAASGATTVLGICFNKRDILDRPLRNLYLPPRTQGTWRFMPRLILDLEPTSWGVNLYVSKCRWINNENRNEPIALAFDQARGVYEV